MRKFGMAGIQMNATKGDNLDKMTRLTELAKKRYPWIELVMFGELSAFGTSLNAAQPMPGPAENHFCSLAKKHGIWMLPGSFYEMEDDKIYNTTPVSYTHLTLPTTSRV